MQTEGQSSTDAIDHSSNNYENEQNKDASTSEAINGFGERTELLVGIAGVERLRNVSVLIVGLGGVGAMAAEMLCRAGVGSLTLADHDLVSQSNINRQVIALTTTIGRDKTEVLTERLAMINPQAQLRTKKIFVSDDTLDQLLDVNYDYVVDAIDTLAPKVALIAGCLSRNLPLVSSMGAGAKLDPSKVSIADISKTHTCPLAYMLRKRLRHCGIRHGFKAVFSSEPVMEQAVKIAPEKNKKTVLGTISYLPAVFGCFCASEVIRRILEK